MECLRCHAGLDDDYAGGFCMYCGAPLTVAAATASEAAGAGGRRFSETAWFAAAVDPETLGAGEAADPSEVEDRTQQYTLERPLPSGVRRRWSLTMGRKAVRPPGEPDDASET